MAAGEKTEAPTQKKVEDARKRGQVAHSREVDSAIVLLAVVGVFRFSGEYMWSGLEAITLDTWAHLGTKPLSIELTSEVGLSLMWRSVLILAPLMGLVAALSVVGGMAQTGGPLFSREAVTPQFKRMNPVSGAQRLVASRQAYVNLTKALISFTVVGAVGYFVFVSHWEDIVSMGAQQGLSDSLAVLVAVSFDLATWVSVAVLLLAIADFVFQKTDMLRQLRMSRQEIKDEHRQAEGDPHMRAAMARHRRSLMSRLMESVGKADVVLVNPTHYAVAIKYDPATSNAPIVLAKGMNLIALRMREVAEERGIPVIQNPPLTRAIYRGTRIGQEIPTDLYEAVAEILAFVYRLRTRGRVRATA